MTDRLLLPSAILVPDELRLDLGRIPTGMIPLHGRPMIHHIIEGYDDIKPYIACHERADLIEKYVDRKELNWELLHISQTDSLGETINQSIKDINTESSFGTDDQLYINFADTLVTPHHPASNSDFISYAKERNPIRWTSFEGQNRIESITRKFSPSASGHRRVFTGHFRILDPVAFREVINANIVSDSNGPDPFYQGLLSYLQNREYDLIKSNEWIDVGHLDTYHRAKKTILERPRVQYS